MENGSYSEQLKIQEKVKKMKLKKLLKTYNAADSYYYLTVLNGENTLLNELEIENNDFSFIDEEILNMKVFDWWDRYYFNIGNGPIKNWMQLTVRVK